jgi:N-acetylglucosaminyldiphosphoundecaprenol N-acetyl-beta-D-mannosaminyltransferase
MAGSPTSPKVSAILNAYNGEKYLREAIDSVIAQTFPDWELIIWDNGSVDRTLEIASSYDDPRIRICRSEDLQSLGKVRSYAIREARGEWIAFIDHDDIWYPRKLEKQIALAEDPSVGIVYGRSVRFSDGGRRRDFDHRHEFSALPEGRILENLIAEGSFFTMSCAMMRRSAVAHLLDELESIDLCQDYFLFLSIAENFDARAVDEPICHYRIHPGNISRVRAARMHREILRLIDRWAPHVDRAIVRRRKRVFETNLGVAELRRPSTFARGTLRIVRRGSVPYLLSRPLARGARAVRRRVQLPRWRRHPLREATGSSPFRRVELLGTGVCASPFDAAVNTLRDLASERRPGYISAANAYSLSLARSDPGYRAIVNASAFTTADGMPLVWLMRALGHEDAERVHNDDLFFACCERFANWRHFFVGGRDGQPEELVGALRKQFPAISIVGAVSTPIRPGPEADTQRILNRIREAEPTVVWVGMGTPAQDIWMSAVVGQLSVPMVGVGSLFDLVTGRTRPTPEWMKRSGLQWAYRLSQEPRRLAGRYFWHNSIFVIGAARQILADRLNGDLPRARSAHGDARP